MAELVYDPWRWSAGESPEVGRHPETRYPMQVQILSLSSYQRIIRDLIMKIRTGFVSNSSSSSFCMYCFEMDNDDVKKFIKKHEVLLKDFKKEYFDTELEFMNEFLYSPGDFEFPVNYKPNSENDFGLHRIYVGRDYKTLKDDETGREFRESVKQLAEFFGVDPKKCRHLSEAWSDY